MYDLIKGANQRVWVQNQYINLNPQEDFPEFKKIVNVLLKKIEAGLDVRIICRDLMDTEKLDMLLAWVSPRRLSGSWQRLTPRSSSSTTSGS